MNKILTANLSGTFPAMLKRDVYTRRTATCHRHATPECRYLQSSRIYTYMRGPSTGDGRTSVHTTRALPVRIRKVHTPDKIPELHFVWNCNFAGFTYGSSFHPASHPPTARSPPCRLFRCRLFLHWSARGVHYINVNASTGVSPRGEWRYMWRFSLGKQQAAARV